MYEIGRFTVVGEGESAPAGSPSIRLIPYAHYAAYPWWSTTTQAVLEALPELVHAGARVLDFGCGASAIVSIAIAELDATPYPVEVHPELASIAQRQLAANGLTMAVLAEPLAVPYDVAVANVGDAELVGRVSKLAAHGIGTDRDGNLIRW